MTSIRINMARDQLHKTYNEKIERHRLRMIRRLASSIVSPIIGLV